MKRRPAKKVSLIIHDLCIIALSIGISVFLVKTDVLVRVLTSTKELELIGSFVSGIFFTSVFTTAPAIVTLGEIAQVNSVFLTALLGSLGAVFGDLIIFYFIRDRLSSHLMELISERGLPKRLKKLFKMRMFRWFTFLLGGIIIASPLPDELGIGLLGFSKMKLSWFVPISLVFNFIGILLIGLLARSV